ncbi:MAG: hypothetical protein E6R04_06215 [Spirochaetes bacterium]|nr:MAG: hypothetical protein E6R04_06215 [Spirochaetota bacterium]
MTVISAVRFTTELCGYHQLKDVNVKELQEAFATSIEKFYLGRVPFGDKKFMVGVQVNDSKDPVLGTAVCGSVQVYLGVEGEDLDRACRGFITDPETVKRYPHTTWEPVNDETLTKRAEEKKRRQEYSRTLVADAEEKAKSAPRRAPVPVATPSSSIPTAKPTDEEIAGLL